MMGPNLRLGTLLPGKEKVIDSCWVGEAAPGIIYLMGRKRAVVNIQ